MKKEDVKALLCIPNRGTVAAGILKPVVAAMSQGLAGFCDLQDSMLTRNFNSLLAASLNARLEGISHFILLHDDVVPEENWYPKMIDIMLQTDADVLSAVIPLKGGDGQLTSTAIGHDYKIQELKRLTLQQCRDLGETFTRDDLLINTGLMCIDIRSNWVENIWFRFEDKIIKDKNGVFHPWAVSEDWLFSIDAKKLGAKLYATTAIKVSHEGGGIYNNY